jgi:hypothetical protein
MDPHVGQRWDPAFLGPLDDEFVPVTGAVRLFPGEDRYLSKRKLDAREKLWRVVHPHLQRVLEADETVLHVAPVIHNPRFLEVFGFGMWYVLFFRAALVLTDRRVVEIMLRKPDRADSHICSYSWGQVKSLKFGFGTLTLKPAEGRAQKWKFQERGDRKLMQLLLPKIQQQLLPGDIHVVRPVPLWHCPGCGAASPKIPEWCGHCETRFKSRGLAAGLAVAFPGAGLLYAGHPVLAALDLVGESVLFFMVAVSFLFAAGPAEIAAAMTMGAMFLFFTKLESAHVATVLAHRTRPDPNRAKWIRGAAVGAVLSLVLVVLPPAFSGAFGGLINLVDRDLDFASNELGWSGSLDPAQWQFGVEPNQRSEWVRDDGQSLFVWSLPLGPDDTQEQFTADVTAGLPQADVQPVVIGGLDGFRVVEERLDEDGEPFVFVRWMLFDRDFDDVHILGAPVLPGGVGLLEVQVDELLAEASWVVPTS